jgi:carboxymethylenebutenolidase
MNKSFSALLLVVGVMATPNLWGQDSKPSLPDPKDHEFNEKRPTRFAGAESELKSKDGTAFKVYLSGPKDSKKAILLVHEWWGLNAHIKGTVDHFGRLGYRTLALDLYGGQVAKTPAEAQKYMSAVKADAAQVKLTAALKSLAQKGRKIGTIGWCFGGGWSLKASVGNPDLVQATVMYYGLTINDPATLRALKSPVLGIFAKKDGWITPAKVKSFEDALKKAGVTHEVTIYDAAHAFANPSGTGFQRKSARAAWKQTLGFFEKHLK